MTTTCADGVREAWPLYRADGDGSIPISALQLWLWKIEFPVAIKLNKLWHSRLPRYGRGFIKNQSDLCYAGEFGGLYYAAAIWSNPVARALPQYTWMELRRLAVAPDAPRNTASFMLGVMARLIRREHPEIVRLISYHDTSVHTGAIYRAAGWMPTVITAGDEWDRPSRRRPAAQSIAKKQRWEKELREDPGEERS